MNTALRLTAALGFIVFAVSVQAAEMRMAVTTSLNNSGLSDVLLPQIKKDIGLDVHLLVVGTGQALKLGRAGDVDAILVHSKTAEETFISEGFATHRREIMYNDFVLVGPENDPAGIAQAKTSLEAFQKISTSRSPFVSRGDDSGTHKKELSLWEKSGQDVQTFDPTWYRAAGAGMGASLNTATGMSAYIMADRASWLKFANKGDLKLLFSGDPALFNQYAYLPINPNKHAHVQRELAARLENWLTGNTAQQLIREYRINGEPLFTPNAKGE